jgi:hypothetical protein
LKAKEAYDAGVIAATKESTTAAEEAEDPIPDQTPWDAIRLGSAMPKAELWQRVLQCDEAEKERRERLGRKLTINDATEEENEEGEEEEQEEIPASYLRHQAALERAREAEQLRAMTRDLTNAGNENRDAVMQKVELSLRDVDEGVDDLSRIALQLKNQPEDDDLLLMRTAQLSEVAQQHCTDFEKDFEVMLERLKERQHAVKRVREILEHNRESRIRKREAELALFVREREAEFEAECAVPYEALQTEFDTNMQALDKRVWEVRFGNGNVVQSPQEARTLFFEVETLMRKMQLDLKDGIIDKIKAFYATLMLDAKHISRSQLVVGRRYTALLETVSNAEGIAQARIEELNGKIRANRTENFTQISEKVEVFREEFADWVKSVKQREINGTTDHADRFSSEEQSWVQRMGELQSEVSHLLAVQAEPGVDALKAILANKKAASSFPNSDASRRKTLRRTASSTEEKEEGLFLKNRPIEELDEIDEQGSKRLVAAVQKMHDEDLPQLREAEQQRFAAFASAALAKQRARFEEEVKKKVEGICGEHAHPHGETTWDKFVQEEKLTKGERKSLQQARWAVDDLLSTWSCTGLKCSVPTIFMPTQEKEALVDGKRQLGAEIQNHVDSLLSKIEEKNNEDIGRRGALSRTLSGEETSELLSGNKLRRFKCFGNK